MLRKLRKKIPKRSSEYIPAPTLPVLTTVPPIPWRFKKFNPDPNFHATLNKFAESALTEDEEPTIQKFGEPIIPNTLDAPCNPQPEPPKP